MAFPTSITDIIATTIESRTKKIADNVTKNNALLARLQERGNIRNVTGGSVILEELSFNENGNASWYSGYDLLPVAAQDVISAAQYTLKQLAVPVVISGLEQLQNAGREEMISLMESRLAVAESTMANRLSEGVYGDGTAYGGKTIVGLEAAIPETTTNTYGGIDRGTWTFWRNQTQTTSGGQLTNSTIQQQFNAMYAKLIRGSDRADLIVLGNTWWGAFVNSLQLLQRFTGTEQAKLGFPSVKFFDADVVLDGGIGGYHPDKQVTAFGPAYFINSKYFRLRPHKDRNMVALNPNRRYAINQDAEVQILAWAGALTCNGAQFQGRLYTTT